MFDRLSILLLDLAGIARDADVLEALNNQQCSTSIHTDAHEVHRSAIDNRPDLIVITTPEVDDALLNLSASLEYANPEGRIYTVLVAATDDIDPCHLQETNVACLCSPPDNWQVFSQQMHLMAITSKKASLLESAYLDANSALHALAASTCSIDIASESCRAGASLLRLLEFRPQQSKQRQGGVFHWRLLLEAIHQPVRERLADAIRLAIKEGASFSCEVALAADPNVAVHCIASLHKTQDGRTNRLQLSWQRTSGATPSQKLAPKAVEWVGCSDIGQLSERLHSRASGTVLFIRVEGFTEICKSLGYVVGQQVLAQVREQVLGELRSSDIIIQDSARAHKQITRIGGAELIVILDEVAETHHVARVKKRLQKRFKQALCIDQRAVPVRVSIGAAVWPEDGIDANELLLSASLSADCSHITDDTNTSNTPQEIGQARNAIRLEADLYDAVLNEELTLLYQPKYSLADGKISGVEALLRWHNGHKTWIQPDIFIPIAERNGLIVQIGQWVISEAMRCHSRWYRQGLGRVSIAINISSQQLADSSIVDFLKAEAIAHQVPTEYIELEITESCLIENAAQTTHILQTLSEEGFIIALDDFGTGFSSLSYLQTLPLDVLKIDRSFVNALTEHSYDPGLIAGIVGIGLTLGLRIVAEGIENEMQWELLNDWGCHYGQGFMMSRPVPEMDAANLIADGLWSGAMHIQGVRH